MSEKKSNICVSMDYIKSVDILRCLDTLKNNICLGEDVINEEKYFKAINISGVDQLLKN